MGFISKLTSTVVGAITAVPRFGLGLVRGAANAATLVLRTPVALLTGNWSGVKKDIADLKDTAKGLAYTGAEIACAAAAPFTGGLSLAGSFALSYAETSDRGGVIDRLKRGTIA